MQGLSRSSPMTTRFPALASRDYRLFWSGQAISLIGTWMQSTVQPYLAYRLTGQPIFLGAIGFATTLPTLLLTLPGGVLVERVDKRRVVIVMQTVMMLQAFALGALALSGHISIWHIAALAFVLGAANSIEITARQSLMIELVGKEALPNAIALNSTIFNAARVLGPMASAPFLVLLKDNGEGWAFLANGVSYLFVIVSLLLIRTRTPPAPAPKGVSGMAQFREGQRYVARTPVVRLLVSMAAMLGLVGVPFSQQIPVFARDVLRQTADTAATVATRNSLLVTAVGVGALVAAVSLTLLSGTRHKGRLLIAGQLMFASGLMALALTKTLAVTLPLLALVGWGLVTQLAMTNTLIQLVVPNELRGRVISTYLWALQGVAPFGSLLIGGLAQWLGAPAAVLIGGAVCLLASVGIHTLTPTLRQFRE